MWRMQEYLNQVRHLQSRFKSFNLLQIPRSENTNADSLATLATSSTQSLPWVILLENLCKPTKMKRGMVHIHQIRMGPSWMDSIVLFLKKDVLHESKSEADKVQRQGTKESSSVLAVRGPKVIQEIFFWSISAMHTL